MSSRKDRKVSQHDIDRLYRIQRERCGCCGTWITKQAALDHNHQTGATRGLLCRSCNIAEGTILKTGLTPRAFAERLEQYLKNPPANDLELE